jgi:hypothetical protein
MTEPTRLPDVRLITDQTHVDVEVETVSNEGQVYLTKVIAAGDADEACEMALNIAITQTGDEDLAVNDWKAIW